MPATETKIPPRPVPMGKEVINAVAETVIRDVTKWLEARDHHVIHPELFNWLLRSVDPNAYLFAKKFEEASSFTPDAHLVEAFTIEVMQQYWRCVREWVSRYDIQVPSTHKIGARVSTVHFPRCTVVGLNEESARIGIRPDNFPYELPAGGFAIPFEDAIPIIGTIGEPAAVVGGAA